MAERDYLPLL